MKNLFVIFVLCAMLISGCVKGSFEEDSVCSNKQYPTIQSGLPIKVNEAISAVDKYDFSDAISKVKDFGDVELTLKTATLTSKENYPLTFIESLKLSVIKEDGSEEVIGSTDNNTDTTITLSLKASPEVVQALKSGPVTFKLTGSGYAPSKPVTPIFSMCVSAKANVDATLSDVLSN